MSNDTKLAAYNDATPLLAALRSFVRQRPNMDPRNYGDHKAYRREYREVTRDKQDALALLDYIAGKVPAWRVEDAFRGSRLKIHRTPDGWRLEYVTGQYFPTEYRRCVAYQLAGMIENLWRETDPDCTTLEGVHARARKEFGRGIAWRYFGSGAYSFRADD